MRSRQWIETRKYINDLAREMREIDAMVELEQEQ
ncbi:hypothetical protein SAMN05421757_10816 [Tropicimonas sediminicola]|uniref:Uncharacterized protein n=1 Tax=Tropicimonas sediminicola TaxID=1031541 RepID=A0A239KVF9_9RHOB|nr:hypothetical protein SAMN05421757_10816 [Tropicimonas sediminicola]